MDHENDLQYIGEDSQIVASNVYISANTYPLVKDKHNENITIHLANAGPVGIAAAEAISSCRYFKSSFHFEIDPVVRKRLQTKLLRKIKSTMDEYTSRVGQQIAMLNCIPSSKLPIVQQFKIYGSKKIELALKSQRSEIMIELDKFLANKIRAKKSKIYGYNDNDFKELPILNVDGIPTPLDKMTQLQLRNFIPEMLRLSTGRVKPGWKRFEFCPVWWPTDVPWANIRTDIREEEEKNVMSWTACLRSIVLSCYQYHNCEHLLPDYNSSLNLFCSSERNASVSMDLEEPISLMENKDNQLKHVSNYAELNVENKFETVASDEAVDLKNEHPNELNFDRNIINNNLIKKDNIDEGLVNILNLEEEFIASDVNNEDWEQLTTIHGEMDKKIIHNIANGQFFKKNQDVLNTNNRLENNTSQYDSKFSETKSTDESPIKIIKMNEAFNSIDGRPVLFFKLSNRLNIVNQISKITNSNVPSLSNFNAKEFYSIDNKNSDNLLTNIHNNSLVESVNCLNENNILDKNYERLNNLNINFDSTSMHLIKNKKLKASHIIDYSNNLPITKENRLINAGKNLSNICLNK